MTARMIACPCRIPWWRTQFARNGSKWRCRDCGQVWVMQVFILYVCRWVHEENQNQPW